jgi:hypothetical protein
LNELGGALKELGKEVGDEWHSHLRIAILHHHLVHFPGMNI